MPELDAHGLDVNNLFTSKGDVAFSDHVHDADYIKRSGQFPTGPILLTAGAGVDQVIADTINTFGASGNSETEDGDRYIGFYGCTIDIDSVTGAITLWFQLGEGGSIYGALTASQIIFPAGGTHTAYVSGAQEFNAADVSANSLQLLARRDNVTGTQNVYHAWCWGVRQETMPQPPDVF